MKYLIKILEEDTHFRVEIIRVGGSVIWTNTCNTIEEAIFRAAKQFKQLKGGNDV